MILFCLAGNTHKLHAAFSRLPQDTIPQKTELKYPFRDKSAIPQLQQENSPLFLKDPSNISTKVVFDPERREYIIYQQAGNLEYRMPYRMSIEEYREYEMQQAMRQYWKAKISGKEEVFQESLIPKLQFGGQAFDKVFGSNTITITPQGSAELIFGINISRIDNPTLSEKLRKVPTFDFQNKIQMNVTGAIGDKMQLGINYNTEATFDWENKTKLEYSGKEDEIIKKIEAGDVTLPLTGSLITGSQSLFGLKTELQFGRLTMTNVFSQQKGETSVIEAKGGAQVSEYEVYVNEYEGNKHFFLSHYFRDTYDQALSNLPVINSGVNIERIEVWITNKTTNIEDTRNVLALMDMAESQAHIYNAIPAFQQTGSGRYPENSLNGLYEQLNTAYSGVRNLDQITNTLMPLYPDFQIGRDYEKIENARKLKENEYSLNRQLGYISLNISLNSDEVLAVAYEYTLNGRVYKVGEFSTDGISAPEVLMLKLLKGTNLTPRLPNWDLMMKNIYALGAFNIDQRDFKMQVLYQDDETGNAINYLPEGELSERILLEVMNLDKLNRQLDPSPDGVFDFINRVTIWPDKGRIIFPVVEPFGSHLKKAINDPALAERYVFQELYDSTQVKATQIAEKNKFILRGSYSSSSGSEIPLNAFNIPKGSVKVTAGGITLTENVDYTVDYNSGYVKIINPGLLESSTPIRVSLESNQFFAMQTKTMVGTHLDYRVSENFLIGGTLLHLHERPLTQKVNFGDEPISNTIYGINTSYNTESRFLTSLIDKLPFIETKTPSRISFSGEFAHLVPGHSRAISDAGNSYIDDFEASETPIDMKSLNAWVVASTPQGQEDLFPEAALNNDLAFGYNRARLAWYVIDPLFLRNGGATPGHIKADPDLQSSHFVREVYETEIFPFKESQSGIPTNIAVLNMAYYPSEKGPYNYDAYPTPVSAGINADGRLNMPETRWGGMMREISTSDFEAANIQFIEFWVMDPFVENTDHEGGDLYFNLGNVSEDILRDSRKMFENGLPNSPEVNNVDTTVWGRVPTVQSLINAFDNDPNSRRYQDVGLDGLRNEDEISFYSSYLADLQSLVSANIYTEMAKDPSSDDFHYFRGSDYDAQELGILERYKQFNGQEDNSPTAEQSDEDYPTSGSTLPDIEDINRDNTLNETESYYQYRVSMRPEDMVVGSNYIVDEVEYTATFANGTQSQVKWYQFRIPVNDSRRQTIGTIEDFKSIRFMRMLLRGFNEEVVLRFAKLDLVRGEWRSYNLSFLEGGERTSTPEPSDGTFEISSVNIEENAGKEPVNYVLPPGFNRMIDPQNPQLRQLNEQSMVLRVHELEDGDARAAFKNVLLDFRQYSSLNMEVHGEALIGELLDDNELTVFIRLGSDYKGNYYEYEIPLKLTPPGRYGKDNDADRRIVWPEENAFKIDMAVFQEAKQMRNRELLTPGSSLSMSDVYIYPDGQNRVSVSGNPNLSNIKTIMVGVRNPIKNRDPLNDDGMPKSGEIWINELRLSDFNEEGGWAANARLQTRLADLGSVDVAGLASTPGWGSLESKVNERSKEEILQYDLSSNVELGKFLPEESGVSIPMYVGYSEGVVNPQYNPLDPDIPLKEALDNAPTEAVRDSIRKITQDYTRRKSINFTNVGVVSSRGEREVKPWSLSNFKLNYSFNEYYARNINTEIDLEKTYRGGITYNYDRQSKNITPLKGSKLLSNKHLRVIRDFNFNLFPQHLSFRTNLTRYYNEVKTRNINNPFLKIEPTFQKDFEWTRFYDIRYDITRALKVDFTANNVARIDEPFGGVDKDRYKDEYEQWKDSVMYNLKNLGRTTRYNHVFNARYTLPINKIPLLNWTSANVQYGATYDWNAGPLYADSVGIDMGNTIKNSSNIQLNGQLNMVNLYNKVGFLKNVDRITRPGAARNQRKEYETVTFVNTYNRLFAGRRKTVVHNLKTEDVKVRVVDSEGNEVKGEVDIPGDTRIRFTPEEDQEDVTVTVEGQVEIKDHPLIVAGNYLLRALMGVRTVSLSYSETSGTFLPGYKPTTQIMGMSQQNGHWAPGLGFVMGWQDEAFADRAVQYGWITTDSLLSSPMTMAHSETFNIRTTIEPVSGLRIDLSADRRFGRNINAYYTADRFGNFPDSTRNRLINGNFTMSYITLGTAFQKIEPGNNYSTEAWENFKEYTGIISERQSAARRLQDPAYQPNVDPVTGQPLEGPFKNGYGQTSQEVLIPAFLAAYGNSDPSNITLKTFPSVLSIRPNWRVQFDGLSKIPFIQRFMRSININHQYRSTFNIGSYTTNLYYDAQDGISRIRDFEDNFIPQFEINTVSINEQFSPLINFDMNWLNSLSTRVEIKKSRTISLSLANNQITEVLNNELVIGMGYRFEDVQIIIRTGGVQRDLKSDLNVRADFSIKDNKTLSRKLIEDVTQAVAGQRILSIKTTADYVLSDRFNLSVFFDHMFTNPFVARTFPTGNTNFGFSLRFTLVQ